MRNLAPLACLFLAAGSVQCGESGTEGLNAPRASGDQSVFAELEVGIEVWAHDHLDHDARIAQQLDVPPIGYGFGLHVAINGGVEAGRVPDLHIYVDGVELVEVGSAALPESFSYQYYPEDAIPGASATLEFRRMESSYSLVIEPLSGEITTPESGAIVMGDRPLLVRWVGSVPVSGLSVGASHYSQLTTTPCAVRFVSTSVGENEASFTPERSQPGHETPCTGEASLTWVSEAPIRATPFRASSVTRSLTCMQRFDIR